LLVDSLIRSLGLVQTTDKSNRKRHMNTITE